MLLKYGKMGENRSSFFLLIAMNVDLRFGCHLVLSQISSVIGHFRYIGTVLTSAEAGISVVL